MMMLLIFGLACVLSMTGADDTVTVNTPLGAVLGVSDGSGTDAFMGIPYAEPPVGPHGRWQPPVAVSPWRETLDATGGPGPACWQRPNPGVGEMSEDCLHLHVWRPSTKHKLLLPVLVYLHGGSLVEGSAVAIQS